MKKALIIIMLVAACSASGQRLRLFGGSDRSSLYFNLDRIWSYNLYEHSRWGGGFHFTVPIPFTFARKRDYDVYFGYSCETKQWKGGLSLAWHLRGSRHDATLYTAISHDYATAGGRTLAEASRSDLGSMSTFMSQRMNEQTLFLVGFSREVFEATVSVEGRWFRGFRLYDNDGLFYRMRGDELPREDGWEARFVCDIPAGVIVQLQTGVVEPDSRRFTRLLAQYHHTFKYEYLNFNVFAQGGLTSQGTPYTYLFDLGGTFGAPICFNNSLLMALPNEFTANRFALMSLRLEKAKPLYRLYSRLFSVGSVPVPFVGINATIGTLDGMDADGSLYYEGLWLQAPHRGILEPVVGIDGIFRWGAVDWGVAAAYRVAPQGVVYHHDELKKNVSLMLTAKLVL